MSTGVADLMGVRAKLRRAEEHNSTLKVEVDAWVKQHADAMVFYIRRDGPWYVVKAEPFPEPDIRFSIIAGDVLHNLRCALDHLVFQLILRDGHEPSRRNEFPIYDSQKRFFDDVKFRKSKPKLSVLYGIQVDGDAWTIIEKAQPYLCVPLYSSAIRVIGRLSNLDKHRTLLVQSPLVGEDISQAIGWNSEAVLLEQRKGITALSLKEPTEVIRYRFADEPNPHVHVKGSLTISPTVGEGKAKDSYQVGVGFFGHFINEVTKVVDEVSRLPRVIDVKS